MLSAFPRAIRHIWVRRLVLFTVSISLLYVLRSAAQIILSGTPAVSGTNYFTTFGVVGDQHVILSADTVDGPKTDVATNRVDLNGQASFVFPALSNATKFYMAEGTGRWTPLSSIPAYPPPPLTNINGIRILSLPEDQIAQSGTEAVFVVQAERIDSTNVPPLFQWYKNETLITNATNHFLYLTNVTTNIDVGFYSCDVGTNFTGTNIPYRARSKDAYAPGARLFVYVGTNTPITGPFQPAPSGSGCNCAPSYLGWVQFVNPEPGPYYGSTYFGRPTGKTSFQAVDRTSTISGYQYRIFSWETGASNPARCGNQNSSLPATGTISADAPTRYLYQFTTYITGTTDSTVPLGTPVTLEVVWSP